MLIILTQKKEASERDNKAKKTTVLLGQSLLRNPPPPRDYITTCDVTGADSKIITTTLEDYLGPKFDVKDGNDYVFNADIIRDNLKTMGKVTIEGHTDLAGMPRRDDGVKGKDVLYHDSNSTLFSRTGSKDRMASRSDPGGEVDSDSTTTPSGGRPWFVYEAESMMSLVLANGFMFSEDKPVHKGSGALSKLTAMGRAAPKGSKLTDMSRLPPITKAVRAGARAFKKHKGKGVTFVEDESLAKAKAPDTDSLYKDTTRDMTSLKDAGAKLPAIRVGSAKDKVHIIVSLHAWYVCLVCLHRSYCCQVVCVCVCV